jgi:flagellar basal body-associated protein FliL
MKRTRGARRGKQTRNAIILVALLAVIAAVGIAVVHFRSVALQPAEVTTPADQASPGGKIWGRAGAPVTIEVYSDFL